MTANVYDGISITESVDASVGDLSPSVNDAISVAENVSTPNIGGDQNVSDVISLAEYVALNLPFVSQNHNMAFGVLTAASMATGSFNPFASDATGFRFPALAGKFNVSVSGTFTATVTLQRSFDRGTTWHSTTSNWTAAGEAVISACEDGVLYRAYTTAYTSGTALVRLSN